MRPVVLHHFILALFAGLTLISDINQPTSPSSASVFKKSPSLTSIGSQLLPSFSSSSAHNHTLSPSQSTNSLHRVSSHGSGCSSSGVPETAIVYKICTLIFEIFAALCLVSPLGYDTILNVISEVNGEQYRFERLVQGLEGLECRPRHTASPEKRFVSKLSSLIEDQQELFVFDCLTAALNLFNGLVQTPDTIEKRGLLRTELERRGFEDLVKRLDQKKKVLPESLQKQVEIYLQSKKIDQDKLLVLENTKRQSVLQL